MYECPPLRRHELLSDCGKLRRLSLTTAAAIRIVLASTYYDHQRTLVSQDVGSSPVFVQVYDIKREADELLLNTVVRVACPAFPRDKLESEVRLLKAMV